MFSSVFAFTLLPRISAVLHVLLSLLLTIDGLQFMNKKSLFAEPSYTTSAPPEKTPLIHAHSTDYVEITYKKTSF
jgi:hypothetical protein